MRQALLTVFAISGIFACSACTDVNVIGGCEVPAHYDVTKTVSADLPAHTTVKQFAAAATAERGQHKIDVDDYNGFLGYVKAKCQGQKPAP